jgi:hypothetical protein
MLELGQQEGGILWKSRGEILRPPENNVSLDPQKIIYP